MAYDPKTQGEAQKIENVVNLLRQDVREQDAEGIAWTLNGFKLSEIAESPRQVVESLVANHHKKELAECSANGNLCAEILEVEVPLGPQQIIFTGRLTEECFAQLEQMLADEAPLDSLQLKWQKGRLKELCFDWLPDLTS